jgi:plastocyanin
MTTGIAARCGTALAIVFAGASASAEDATNTIVQNGRAFHPAEITIPAGSTLDFSNQDEFIHQIYVDTKDFDYDSAEQSPGVVFHITFPDPGTYFVRCHIHPKMLLTVHVK